MGIMNHHHQNDLCNDAIHSRRTVEPFLIRSNKGELDTCQHTPPLSKRKRSSRRRSNKAILEQLDGFTANKNDSLFDYEETSTSTSTSSSSPEHPFVVSKQLSPKQRERFMRKPRSMSARSVMSARSMSARSLISKTTLDATTTTTVNSIRSKSTVVLTRRRRRQSTPANIASNKAIGLSMSQRSLFSQQQQQTGQGDNSIDILRMPTLSRSQSLVIDESR